MMKDTEKIFTAHSIGKLDPFCESIVLPAKWDLSGLMSTQRSFWNWQYMPPVSTGGRQGGKKDIEYPFDAFDPLIDQEIDPDYRQWGAY
jgi:hypothetical protein